MKVLKFGAKLLNSVANIKSIAQIIGTSDKKIVVLSAKEGTTEKLATVLELVQGGKDQDANQKINELEADYKQFFNSLNSDAAYQTQVAELLSFRLSNIRKFNQDLFNVHKAKELLAQGELLFSELFGLFLTSQKVDVSILSALDFMRIDNSGEPDLKTIKADLTAELAKQTSNTIITQSFICRNPFGQVDRHIGGGDFTASVIGGVIGASEVQLYTSNKSFQSVAKSVNQEKSRQIKNLSFDEAAEVAYFGEKVIHPASITPAKLFNVPVRILNSFDDTTGTLITDSEGTNLKAIVAKDGIVAIKIKSSRMLMAYGFLRNVFEIFEYYKTSIDMITTSEVAVSLTIEDTEHLDAIVKSLDKFGTVEVDKNQTIVSVIGDFIHHKNGYANEVSAAVSNIPLRMISYGGSKNNISLLIDSSNKTEALKSLSNALL
jgi:aspartate kinase